MPPDTISNTSIDSLNATVKKNAPASDSIIHPSFFRGHLLENVNKKPLIHYTNYEYLPSAILFFAFILFVWLYVSNNKFMNQLLKNFYSIRLTSQLAREQGSIVNRVTVFLSIMFVMVITLFIAKSITFYQLIPQDQHATLLFKIAGGIIGIYIIKLLVIRFLGHVFKNNREAFDYMGTVVLFWNASALFLFPVLCCLLFLKQVNSHVFIMIGAIGMAMLLLIRFGKVIVIGINNPRVSKLYLFLYLCTLEILPFIILYKLFLITIK